MRLSYGKGSSFALLSLFFRPTRGVFCILDIEKTCGTGVSHVEDQPNVADSIWQMLSYLLPLDGVGLAVAERVKLLSKP